MFFVFCFSPLTHIIALSAMVNSPSFPDDRHHGIMEKVPELELDGSELKSQLGNSLAQSFRKLIISGLILEFFFFFSCPMRIIIPLSPDCGEITMESLW